MLQKADKRIRVGITPTDIDSLWAEQYEKGITNPSAQDLVDSLAVISEAVSVCQRKIWGTLGVHGS
jgi:hypothetical protein